MSSESAAIWFGICSEAEADEVRGALAGGPSQINA